MSYSVNTSDVQMIETDSIRVINPRTRNRKKFEEIVSSIQKVGLKRPISVSHPKRTLSKYKYDLVCGQGRLEAFIELGQDMIPAIIIDASEEECMIMSLVENLARRHHTALELMDGIGKLEQRGYDAATISKKTGLGNDYVKNILYLIKNGEERLVAAVERNQIPLTVATEIVNTSDTDIQKAMADAYENHGLKGPKLMVAKRVIEQRREKGKGLKHQNTNRKTSPYQRLTGRSMIQAYQQETDRQRSLIAKSDQAERRLMFIKSSLRELLNDENFTTLLRAENEDDIPEPIADLFKSGV